jgi:hypothetical protein
MQVHDGDNKADKADRKASVARNDSARSTPQVGPAADVLALQSMIGNRAVGQLLRQADDPLSQKQHQHGPGRGHSERPVEVQRSAVNDVLRMPGRPLDDDTRSDMEARMGADFSDVRIHDDSAAKMSAAEVGARAYTSGSHIVIGDGGGDAHTLAHELTHVIQQRQGPVSGTDNGSGLKVSDPGDRFERAAEANATRVMQRRADVESDRGSTTDTHAQAGAGVVQRLATDDHYRIKYTENHHYILEGTDLSGVGRIWVREDASAPLNCTHTGSKKEFWGIKYYAFKPANKFYKDCLHTAEEIMGQRQFHINEDRIRSQTSNISPQHFGDSDSKNIEAARAHKAGRAYGYGEHHENPAVGQAFAVVETEYGEDSQPANTSSFPFHAAAVVAKDGNDCITLEVTAGSTRASQRSSSGKFHVYQVGSTEYSFFAQYAHNFSEGGIAVTLDPH